MRRSLNARLLHHKMAKLLENGKDGDYVNDDTVRGLKYEKQGEFVYARMRVVNRATSKRDNHSFGPVPAPRELTQHSIANGQSLSHVTDTMIEEFRARARSKRLNAREGIVSASPILKVKTVNELWETYEKIELGSFFFFFFK